MPKLITLILLCSLVSGCIFSSNEKGLYQVRMMDGNTLYSNKQPKLDDEGYYRFYDVNEQQYILNKNLILFIDKINVKK